MPCLLVAVAVFFPRLVIILLWLFSPYLSSAYETWIWPVLGFIFAPFTTLAYAVAMNQNHGQLSGWYLALFVVAILFDLSSHGGSESVRRKKVKAG